MNAFEELKRMDEKEQKLLQSAAIYNFIKYIYKKMQK